MNFIGNHQIFDCDVETSLAGNIAHIVVVALVVFVVEEEAVDTYILVGNNLWVVYIAVLQ